jgi:hypothetical protein
MIVVVVPDFGERYISTMLLEAFRTEAAQLPTVDADVDRFYAMK